MINKVSKKNTLRMSNGFRITRANVEANIRVAKSILVASALDNDKNYCWSCGTTSERLTCSHIISVRQCYNDGRSEQAWNVNNIQLECIKCHVQTELRKFSKHKNYTYKKEFIEDYEKKCPITN